MAKKVKSIIKLYCPAGQANPAPPVGPALGQHGLNIMQFCKAFNDKTKGQEALTLPVIITAYEDRTFTFIIKSPPSSVLLKKACGIAKASGVPNKDKVGEVTKKDVEEIAKVKMKDLNANDIEGAMKIVEGTARSMGIEVVEKKSEKPPEEAQAAGLVNHVYDDHEQLLAGAQAMARDIAEKSPVAITGTKEMLNYARDHTIADGLNHIATWQAGMLQTDDIARAINAQKAKTRPNFDDLLTDRKYATKDE